jgi:predicted RNA-binding protein with PUA-like domain
MAYWLMKSEPDVFSIEDLARSGSTIWDGVRNYQARNFMRQMAIGDLVFFYHSNTKPPGIVGLMAIGDVGLDDPTQFDPDSEYFDPKSTRETPRWQTVRGDYRQTFGAMITLDRLRLEFTPEELELVRRGSRLSVIPVSGAVADRLLTLAA